jgi:hypothetical protein
MVKPTRCWMRDVLAVLLAFSGLGVAVYFMLQGELLSQTPFGGVISSSAKQQATAGIMMYFKGIGGAILLSSIAYIMVGQDDTIQTTIQEPAKRK